MLDLTAQVLPSGYDLIHTRDTLQHLECTLIAEALHNLAWSGAKYLLVGSYDGGSGNRNITSGDYFDIDLRRPPFALEPLAVLSENTPKDVAINKLQVGRRAAAGTAGNGWWRLCCCHGRKLGLPLDVCRHAALLQLLYRLSDLRGVDFAAMKMRCHYIPGGSLASYVR